jgi:endonuclease YncB( thermonuclease family)
MGWRAGLLVACFAAACAVVLPPRAGAQTADRPACGADDIARGTVSRVTDGRTVTLDDGREVRLAAIEVPPLNDPDGSPNAAGLAAKDGLAALAQGDRVVLRRAETASDRYGRLFAYAFVERDDDRLFVQDEMLGAGLARAGDRIGSQSCARELLNHEAEARAAKLGLWADPYYDVLHAETPVDVLAHRGRYALVEGKVVSVRESGSVIYVNFGQRWSECFAVTISKRNARSFAAAGLDLNSLTGRRVRVRGWVEQRGGTDNGTPRIEAVRPEQIETIN